jgi:hypothetical protein
MSDELSAFVAKAKESLIASKLLADNQLYDFAGSRAYYTQDKRIDFITPPADNRLRKYVNFCATPSQKKC